MGYLVTWLMTIGIGLGYTISASRGHASLNLLAQPFGTGKPEGLGSNSAAKAGHTSLWIHCSRRHEGDTIERKRSEPDDDGFVAVHRVGFSLGDPGSDKGGEFVT